jgi:hypothetical protein
MSAASQFPWLKELPVSSLPWVKIPPTLFSHVSFRTTPTAYLLLGYIANKACELDTKKNPGEAEVRVTMFELQQASRKSTRAIEYAIEELGPTHAVTNPVRLKKIQEETGLNTVGKNLASIRSDPRRPGEWYCRILPENWTQGAGDPGGPMPLRTRKPKPLEATHDYRHERAAFRAQPVADGPQPIAAKQDYYPPADRGASPQPVAPQPIALGQMGIYGEEPQLVAPDGKRISGEEPQPVALGQQTVAAQLVAAGSPLRLSVQPDAPRTAAGCTGDGSCPYLVRQTPVEENLASEPQQFARATEAEIQDLTQRIARIQKAGPKLPPEASATYRTMGMASRQTVVNLLNGARRVVPGPADVENFLVHKSRQRPDWQNWGAPVRAVQQEFTGWWAGQILSAAVGVVGVSAESNLYMGDLPQWEIPPVSSGENPWQRVQARLKQDLTPITYGNWVARTEFAGLVGDELRVFVPDAITRDWLEDEYGDLIQKILKSFGLDIARVVYGRHGPKIQ